MAQVVPFSVGAKVGLGFNRLTGDVLPTAAIAARSVTALAQAAGQQVTMDCAVIEDVETLHKYLGITIDAGGSYMGFKGGAKVDYVSSCDFSSFSTCVAVKVCVQCATETADDPVFSADATSLLVANSPERFRQMYGDTFIAGIKKGGEYFAIYQITGSSSTERENVAVKVRTAFDAGPLSPVSAHVDTDVASAMATSSSHLEIHCHVFRQGTVAATDMNLADIMKTAKEFPLGVSGDKAFPYELVLQEYSGLKNPNDAYDYVQIQNRQDVLADLAKKRFEFLRLRDDLRYVLKHLADFENADGTPADRDRVAKDLDKVVDAVNTMEREASLCTRDAGHCTFSIFDTAKFDVPVIGKKQGEKLLAQGEAIANLDPMAVELRNSLPDAASQRGFNTAYAIASTDTLPGPGKDAYRDDKLDATERTGWNVAISYLVDRNANADFAKRGAGVAKTYAAVNTARAADSSPVLFRLGFDIATGIFGDPGLGAQGNTAVGPGSMKILRLLSSEDAKRGFNASMKLHLGPPPLKRGV